MVYLIKLQFKSRFRNFCDGWFLDFHVPVTIITGENGSGKSTILDGIKMCVGDGAEKKFFKLSTDCRLEGKVEVQTQADIISTQTFNFGSGFSYHGVLDSLKGQGVLVSEKLQEQIKSKRLSQGQGAFLLLEHLMEFKEGLILLDEAETSLSEVNQLKLQQTLLSKIRTDHLQVVMATHSPILQDMARVAPKHCALFDMESSQYMEHKAYRDLVANRMENLRNSSKDSLFESCN